MKMRSQIHRRLFQMTFDVQDAIAYNTRSKRAVPQALLDFDSRFKQAYDTVLFAQAVYDYQRADLSFRLSDDGKLGQLTGNEMKESAIWLTPPDKLFDVLHERVNTSLLFCDFVLPRPEALPLWAAQMNALGLTHVAVGVNSVRAIKKTPGHQDDPWQALYSAERMALAAHHLARYGIHLAAMPWMSASLPVIDGLMDWLEDVVAACKLKGTPLWGCIPDVEEDWNYANTDHQRLVAHFQDRASRLPIKWLSTFVYHVHKNVRGFVLACPDGAITQVYAHRNLKRDQTLGDWFLPSILQVSGEDRLDAWTALNNKKIKHIHALPLYGQGHYRGVKPHQSIRGQGATSIGLGIQDLAWWSEANIRRSSGWQDLRRIVASFSPRRRMNNGG